MRLMRPHACQVGKTYLLDRDGLTPSSLGSSLETWGRVNRAVGPSLASTHGGAATALGSPRRPCDVVYECEEVLEALHRQREVAVRREEPAGDVVHRQLRHATLWQRRPHRHGHDG